MSMERDEMLEGLCATVVESHRPLVELGPLDGESTFFDGSVADQHAFVRKVVKPLLDAGKTAEALAKFRTLYGLKHANEREMRDFVNQSVAGVVL